LGEACTTVKLTFKNQTEPGKPDVTTTALPGNKGENSTTISLDLIKGHVYNVILDATDPYGNAGAGVTSTDWTYGLPYFGVGLAVAGPKVQNEPFDIIVKALKADGTVDVSVNTAFQLSANKLGVTFPSGDNQLIEHGQATVPVVVSEVYTSADGLKITAYEVNPIPGQEAIRSGTSEVIVVNPATIDAPHNVTAWDRDDDQGGVAVVRWDKSNNDPFAGIGRAVPGVDGYPVMVETRGSYAGSTVITYTITMTEAGNVGIAAYRWTSSGNADGSGTKITSTGFLPIGSLGVEIAFSAGTLAGTETWTIRCTPKYTGGNPVTEYRVLRGDDVNGDKTPDHYHFIASQEPDADAIPTTDVDTYAQDGPGDKDYGMYYVVAYSGTGVSSVENVPGVEGPRIFHDLDAPDAKVGDIFDLSISPAGAPINSAMAGPAVVKSVDNIPPDAVTDLVVEVSGDALSFTWSAVTTGGGTPEIVPVTYNIYRVANEAYFTPNTSNLLADRISGSQDIVTFVDAGDVGHNVVGDVNNNYFYVVKAVDGGGNMSGISNRVGEYDVDLKSTPTTDWNLVAGPVGGEGITKASELQSAILNSNAVAYWVAASQGYVQYVPGIEPTNFPVTRGHSYYVNVTANTIWSIAGSLTTPVFELITTGSTDWNTITVPLDKVLITKASELQADIPNSNAVAYWDAASQGYVQYVPGIEPTNFPVRTGRAYYVNVTANVVWPESSQASPAKELLSKRQLSNQTFGTSPHIVYGVVETSKGTIPKASELTITAFIKDRPSDILTHDLPQNPGTPVKLDYQEATGIWLVQVAGFGKWSQGETLRIDFHDKSSGQSGYHEIILSDDPVQNLSGKVLRLSAPVPEQSALLQNYPNPFNPETWIPYKLAHSSDVTVKIYNIQGQLVRTLNLGHRDAGFYVDKESAAYWDGRNDTGEQVASGVYFYQIKAGTFNATKRLVILK